MRKPSLRWGCARYAAAWWCFWVVRGARCAGVSVCDGTASCVRADVWYAAANEDVVVVVVVGRKLEVGERRKRGRYSEATAGSIVRAKQCACDVATAGGVSRGGGCCARLFCPHFT
jgi:uncharacterized membrane protein YgcG